MKKITVFVSDSDFAEINAGFFDAFFFVVHIRVESVNLNRLKFNLFFEKNEIFLSKKVKNELFEEKSGKF